jgi:hypothetical protein
MVLSQGDAFTSLNTVEIHNVTLPAARDFEEISRLPALTQVMFVNCQIQNQEALDEYFVMQEAGYPEGWWNPKRRER